jgi:hypothetical protein
MKTLDHDHGISSVPLDYALYLPFFETDGGLTAINLPALGARETHSSNVRTLQSGCGAHVKFGLLQMSKLLSST